MKIIVIALLLLPELAWAQEAEPEEWKTAEVALAQWRERLTLQTQTLKERGRAVRILTDATRQIDSSQPASALQSLLKATDSIRDTNGVTGLGPAIDARLVEIRASVASALARGASTAELTRIREVFHHSVIDPAREDLIGSLLGLHADLHRLDRMETDIASLRRAIEAMRLQGLADSKVNCAFVSV